MNKKMKKKLYKIIIVGILFLIAFLLKMENGVINNILFVFSYIIVGKEILEKAIKNITRGKVVRLLSCSATSNEMGFQI